MISNKRFSEIEKIVANAFFCLFVWGWKQQAFSSLSNKLHTDFHKEMISACLDFNCSIGGN